MLKKLSFDHIKTEGSKEYSAPGREKKSPLDSFDFIALIKAWKEIAGQKLSEHTIPLKNQNGTLIILSNHSAFANQLSFMELPLKKKIFERFPNLESSIKNIKFIVDSTYFNTQYETFILSTEKKKSALPHLYSPEYRMLKKNAEDLFKDIDDLELREQMISIFIQTQASSKA